jgi:hypothetical protein
MLPALTRKIDIWIVPEKAARTVEVSGQPLQVQL